VPYRGLRGAREERLLIAGRQPALSLQLTKPPNRSFSDLPEPSLKRDLRLDFFRGLALIFIFVDHVPENVLSYFTLKSTAFFDAAEVFIFISGFTAALVYGRRLITKGKIYAIAQVLRRAWQLYVAHIFLFMLFIAEVSYTATTFNNPMYNEEMRVASFLDEPHIAVVKALILQFQPAFLDILPLYIVLLLIFPVVLLGTQRHRLAVLLLSALLYIAVQGFGLAVPAYPEGHVWFFNPLAWQFLFVSGAVLGQQAASGEDLGTVVRRLYRPALILFAVSFVIRLSWTLHEVWDAFPPLFVKELWPVDKNNLAPIRLATFYAALVVVVAHVPRTARFLTSRAARPLVLCGQQSLEIFCLGILLSALGHFVLAQYDPAVQVQLAVNVVGIAIMFGTAKMIDWYKRMDTMPAATTDARRRREGTGG
jgi:hypothetical protein